MGAARPGGADAAREAVLEAARNGEYDRMVSAFLAPPGAREAMLALAAFAAELARIAPATRREPAMGEIRLQWWREALEDTGDGVTGHPVADAMKAAIREQRWPAQAVAGIIDAHAHDGLADAFADDAELMATLTLGEGALFRLAAQVLGAAPGAEHDQLVENAAVAYGIARRLFALPQLLALGHVPIPLTRLAAAGLEASAVLAGAAEAMALRSLVADMANLARDRLAEARQGLARTSRRIRIGFLPLALVDPYLRTSSQLGQGAGQRGEWLRDTGQVSQMRRLLRITAMHVFGRL